VWGRDVVKTGEGDYYLSTREVTKEGPKSIQKKKNNGRRFCRGVSPTVLKVQ